VGGRGDRDHWHCFVETLCSEGEEEEIEEEKRRRNRRRRRR